MADLHELTVREQLAGLHRGDVSPRELTQHYLDRVSRLNPLVGALVEVTPETARSRASLLEREARDAALWGIPTADKDLVARAGVPTRYGSRLFAEHVPLVSDESALLLDRLGAVSLGKTNTPEFGLTGYTESRVAPPARDPWDLEHGAGGSSGGAAAAVAAGLLPFAPASDGGGSIRIPAATVGVVGLKPSRGRLAVGSGVDSLGGLAVHGPIARSVADAALVLDALAGAAPFPFALRAPEAGSFLAAALGDTGRLRIGVTTVSPWDEAEDISIDPEQAAAVAAAAGALEAAGHVVEDADWRPRGYPDLFRTLWRASTLRLPVSAEALAMVEPITAWLVRSGRELSAADLAEALAAAARFERETIATFAPFDAVLTPALALPPRPIGWFDPEDAERNFVQQVQYAPYSSFVNVAGLPALVLPVREDPAGHPVSAQLIGRPGGEEKLLALGAQLERAVGQQWRPPLW